MTTLRPTPKPTIKDIARLSRASPSTVSSVLSGTWQARRISEDTAVRIRAVAAEHGYSADRRARGLRQGRSGMVAMILPMHEHRFFAAMCQSFEAEARARDACPVVASTLRDPGEETRTVARLIDYAVDGLVIAGATDPVGVGALCRAAGLPHVYVDLPGHDAPSVVSDNRGGAERLAHAVLDGLQGPGPVAFLGGVATDANTAERVRGFEAALAARGMRGEVLACGYAPARVAGELAALRARLGRLPAGLFVNSLKALEGVLADLLRLPLDEVLAMSVGCYDYDPMAAFLRLPIPMIRQDAGQLIARAFAMIDAGMTEPVVELVPPELVPPRTLVAAAFPDLG